jgi:hypothetical protein
VTAPTPPEPPKPPQYMSHISGRSPLWKTHKQRNHLTSALGSYVRARPGATAPEMFAYELNGDTYELMWHIQSGTKIEDLPWSKHIYQPYRARHVQCQCPDCTKS